MTTLQKLRREKERLKNRREAQMEQIQIQKERKKLKGEIKDLKSPKKAAFKKMFGRTVRTGGRLAARGTLAAGKGVFRFADKLTKPTPAQIDAYKKSMRKRK